MTVTKPSLFQAREFARRAGVTVRTLHHYDRIGLLKPSERTAAGHRLYGEREIVRLQQIVTMKFIGFSLKQIRCLLEPKNQELQTMLRLQRRTLEEKRRHLDAAIRAISAAERLTAKGRAANWVTFQKIIEVIQMQNNTDWMMQYYSEDARRAIAERAKDWTPELQARCEADWAALGKDIEAATTEGVDPASARAQALADRWSKLIEGFTGGNPAVMEGLKKLYSDREHWPANATYMPRNDPGSSEFIRQALQHRKAS